MNIKSTLYLLLFFFAVNPMFGQITGTDYTLVTGVSNVFDGTEATSVTSSGNFGTVPTIYTRDISSDDFTLDATSYVESNYGGTNFAFIWRYSGGNYYALTVRRADANYTYRIKKNDTRGNDATGDLGTYTGATGTISLEVEGSSFKLFIGGVERISVTDADYTTGSIGFGQSATSSAGGWTLTAPVFSFPPVLGASSALIDDCSGLDITFSSEVSDEGTSSVTARGFLFSQTESDVDNATIDVPGSATAQASGSGSGTFSYAATSLTAGTWYYKAYARSSDGDVYSSTGSVGPCASPTVTTSSILLSLFCEGAEAEINLTDNGGQTTTSKGILFGVNSSDVSSSTPTSLTGSTIRSNSSNSSSVPGSFSVSLSGLTINTTYYFRSFAINASGTSYGTVESFTTPGLCSSYGFYVGNGEAARELTGLGYDADFLIIRSASSGSSVIASSTMPSGEVKLGDGSTALQSGYLTLITDGFEVSTNTAVNNDGEVYYFLAFEQGDELTVGSYVGNGAANTVTGVGFQPSVVFLMGDHGTFGETGSVGDHFAMDMATRSGEGVRASGVERRIVSSYGVDGYTIGDQANISGETYHYAAFGETTNQKEDTYTGDGVDGREVVVDTDFSPDIAFVSSSSTTPWFFRTASMPSGQSFGFGNSTVNSNSVTGFTDDGFSLGTNGDVNNSGTTHSYFAMKGIQATVLPVELIGFSAKQGDQDVEIRWTTASEINSSHFYVQRSKDGINFETIGRVEGAGNSATVIDYYFNDPMVFEDVTYYRLHQFDIDGANDFSNIIIINETESKALIRVFPNPVSRLLNLNLKSTSNQQVKLKIYDVNGKEVKSMKKSLSEGSNALRVDVSTLSNGVYNLRVEYSLQNFSDAQFVISQK